MDGIFFVLRTGCQWNALNETGICPSSTAHDRFQEWVAAGVFQKLWAAGLQEYDECKGIDWSWQSMDGAGNGVTPTHFTEAIPGADEGLPSN
jgi:transposase